MTNANTDLGGSARRPAREKRIADAHAHLTP